MLLCLRPFYRKSFHVSILEPVISIMGYDNHFHKCSINWDQTVKTSTNLGKVKTQFCPMGETIKDLGFTNEKFMKLLQDYPDFLKVSENNLKNAADSLLKCQFGNSSLIKLIETHPYLLATDPSDIEYMFKKLSSIFKKEHIYQIFYNSPQILNENWEDITDKLNYLNDSMSVSKSEIVKTGAMRFPFIFIKERHIFLERVGVFKKINPKLKPHERKGINPTLDVILNTPAEVFSVKIAGVTVEEYEVFQTLIAVDDYI